MTSLTATTRRLRGCLLHHGYATEQKVCVCVCVSVCVSVSVCVCVSVCVSSPLRSGFALLRIMGWRIRGKGLQRSPLFSLFDPEAKIKSLLLLLLSLFFIFHAAIIN